MKTRFVMVLIAPLLLLGCETVAVTGYLATNAHVETDPQGAGVCLGLPFVNKEICLTAQSKDPSGDIGFNEIPLPFGLGSKQRMAKLEANRDTVE